MIPALCQWVSTLLGAVSGAATLLVCLSAGQDLLMCALKGMGVFFVVRLIGQTLAGFAASLETAAPQKAHGGQEGND